MAESRVWTLHSVRQAVGQSGCASDPAKIRHLVDVYNTFWESLVRQTDVNRDGSVPRAEFWAAMER